MNRDEVVAQINASLILGEVQNIVLSEEARERIKTVLLVYMEATPHGFDEIPREPSIFFSLLNFRVFLSIPGAVAAKIASGGKVFATWTSWMSPYRFAFAGKTGNGNLKISEAEEQTKEGASPHTPPVPAKEASRIRDALLPLPMEFAEIAEALDRGLFTVDSLMEHGLFTAVTSPYIMAYLQNLFSRTEDSMQFIWEKTPHGSRATFALLTAQISATLETHARIMETSIRRFGVAPETAKPMLSALRSHARQTRHLTGVTPAPAEIGNMLASAKHKTAAFFELLSDVPAENNDTTRMYLASVFVAVNRQIEEAKAALASQSYTETVVRLQQAYRLLAEVKIILSASRKFNIPLNVLLQKQ